MESTSSEQLEVHDIFDRIMSFRIFRFMWPFYTKNKAALLYLFFGALTTLVNVVASMVLMYSLPIDSDDVRATVSNVISIILAILFAYVTNKIWVFQSKTAGAGKLFLEFARFVGGRMSTMVIEVGGVYLMFNILGIHFLVSKLVTQVIVIIGNYFISKFLVFNTGKES